MNIIPSPGFTSIYSRLKKRNVNAILDMGEMRPGTYSFFSNIQSKVYFEDLRSFVCDYLVSDEKNNFEQSLQEYMRAQYTQDSYNVVLLWDLLNFLTLDECLVLFRTVAPYCQKNTLIHFFTYHGSKTPETPSRFQLNSHGAIERDELHLGRDKKEVITLSKLLKSLSGYRLENNLINASSVSSGMSENILIYGEDEKSASASKKVINFSQSGVVSFNKKTFDTLNSKFYESNVLKTLLPSFTHTQNTNVLDLGENCPENHDILLKFFNKICVETTAEFIRRIDDEYCLNLRKHSLQYEGMFKFDCIMVWDLFNYLNESDQKKLGEKLSKIVKPGGVIYGLIYSATRPSKMTRFYMRDDLSFTVKQNVSHIPLSKQLNTYQLLKSVPNSHMKNVQLISNYYKKGAKEFLLEL